MFVFVLVVIVTMPIIMVTSTLSFITSHII